MGSKAGVLRRWQGQPHLKTSQFAVLRRSHLVDGTRGLKPWALTKMTECEKGVSREITPSKTAVPSTISSTFCQQDCLSEDLGPSLAAKLGLIPRTQGGAGTRAQGLFGFPSFGYAFQWTLL